MFTQRRKTVVVTFALAFLALWIAVFGQPGNADELWLKLNGSVDAGVCNPPMQAQISPKYRICYVSTSVCLAHGGHTGLDPNDMSGLPHCLGSDLVRAKKP